jgi:Regulator of chromosome condensation (RCC1) repeat/Putative Ig domain
VVCQPCRAAEVVAWGDDYDGAASVPASLSNVVGLAAGGDYYFSGHSLALTAEGRVVAWGDNRAGQATVPAGLSNVVVVAAGGDHSLALTAEGRVLAWGDNSGGQATVPAGLSNVVSVAAGGAHSLALTAEGRVVGWGQNDSGQTSVPANLNNVVAVAAGASQSLALTAEGRVVAWGDNSEGQATVPGWLSNVVAVAAGYSFSLALRADGNVVAWGSMFDDKVLWPIIPPLIISGGMVAVSAVADRCLMLTSGGGVRSWGYTTWNEPIEPAGLSNVVAVAGGGYHVLALTGLPTGTAAPKLVGSRFLVGTVDHPFYYRILAKNGVTTYGANGLPPGLVVDSVSGLITGQPTQAGNFAVAVSAANARGSDQWIVTLAVNLPLPRLVGGLVQAVFGSGFSYQVVTVNAPDWLGASGLPPGLMIDPSSGVISGTPLALKQAS